MPCFLPGFPLWSTRPFTTSTEGIARFQCASKLMSPPRSRTIVPGPHNIQETLVKQGQAPVEVGLQVSPFMDASCF